MKQPKRKEGLTLIELLMAVSLAVFVSGAIASLLLSALSSVNSVGQFHWTYQQARQAMQWINRDVKQSYSILSNATIGSTSYQTDKDTLVLQRSGGVGGKYDFVLYDLVPDTADYLGNTTYKLERTLFKNYDVSGNTTADSTTEQNTVAKNVVAPVGAGYLFNASGTKVSIDMTVSRIERQVKQRTVTLGLTSTGGTGSDNGITPSVLHLVSEIKMRN